MQKFMCSFLTMLACASPICAFEPSDETEIHNIIEHFTYAWNECSGRGTSDFYADDADFVNIFGLAISGKTDIEARHVAIHKSFLKDSIFEVTQVNVREAKSDVAIAHVNWKVSHVNIPGKDITEMTGIFTHVLLKTDGEWKITASHNTPKL